MPANRAIAKTILVSTMRRPTFSMPASKSASLGLPHAVPPVFERLSGRPSPSLLPLSQLVPQLSTKLCALVESCLAEAPEARPTAEVIIGALNRETRP
jgi:hypothetical protein